MRYALILLTLMVQQVSAIIIYGSADPLSHAGPPKDPAKAKLWNYVGSWGPFMGTVISSNFFVTARHVGGSTGDIFKVATTGVSYTAIATFPDPTGADLVLWKVDHPFSVWAPIYHGELSMGRPIFLMGRGTQRGAPVYADCPQTNLVMAAPTSFFMDGVGTRTTNSGTFVTKVSLTHSNVVGWTWGPSDAWLRWGTNTIAYTSSTSLPWQFTGKGADEGIVSVGDSSGAIFVLDDDGVWKLGGIIRAVWPYGTAYFATGCASGIFPSWGYGEAIPTRSTWIWEVTGQQ